MKMLEGALSNRVSVEKNQKETLRSITLTEFSIEGKKYYLRNKMDKVARQFQSIKSRTARAYHREKRSVYKKSEKSNI